MSVMADDFTGVPSDRWRDLNSEIGFARSLAVFTFFLLALLIMALVRKGVLDGWGDLARFAHE